MAKKDGQGAEVATVTVKPSELLELLCSAIPAGVSVLVTGAPGIGKTDVMKRACAATDSDLVMFHPAISDPTDFKGLPWKLEGQNSATFIPFGELKVLLEAVRRTVCFADDLGQALNGTQAAYMQLLHSSTGERRLGDKVLPACITHVAATNRRTDRAGVTGLLEPVKSRFNTIVELVPDLNDWISWYFEEFAGETTEVPAFLRFKPALLSDFQPNADMTNSPSPRTWASVGRILKLGLPQHLEFVALVGAVGAGAAGEFKAFQKVWRELPDLDGILMDPKSAPIPEGPSALYAVCMGLAGKANVQTFGRIATYTERLAKGHHGEFAVLLVQDSMRKDKGIKDTKPFIDLISKTEVGKLIRGESGR